MALCLQHDCSAGDGDDPGGSAVLSAVQLPLRLALQRVCDVACATRRVAARNTSDELQMGPFFGHFSNTQYFANEYSNSQFFSRFPAEVA